MESKLSVFFPCYNEAANVEDTVSKAKAVLLRHFSDWEIVLVNDGSKDKTGEVLDKIAKTDKRIKVIHHPQNRGYGAALKSGMYACRYPWIAFTDADGQFNFSEITTLVDRQRSTGADMVVGYYLQRQVSFYRKLNSFIWQLVVFLLFGLRTKDIDCGFKLFSKKVIDTIPHLESERGAFITSEFLIKAQKYGFKIVEIGVHHYPRTEGKGTGADLNVIVKSFLDLFRLWVKLR